MEAACLKYLVEKSYDFPYSTPARVVTLAQKGHNNDLNVRLLGDIEDVEHGNTMIARIFAEVFGRKVL